MSTEEATRILCTVNKSSPIERLRAARVLKNTTHLVRKKRNSGVSFHCFVCDYSDYFHLQMNCCPGCGRNIIR